MNEYFIAGKNTFVQAILLTSLAWCLTLQPADALAGPGFKHSNTITRSFSPKLDRGIPAEQNCNDGRDNDLNGSIDYEDSNCAPAGNIYFVSESGKDEYDGRAREYDGVSGPKRSVSAIVELLESAPAGSAVLLRRDDTWYVNETPITGGGKASELEIGGGSGTPDKPVILGAYGSGEKPRIVRSKGQSANSFVIRGSDDKDSESQWLIIENLHILSEGTPGDRGVGLQIIENEWSYKPHDITIRKCTIENNDSGIELLAGTNHRVEEVTIKNNYIPSTSFEGRSQGLYSNTDDMELINSTFDNNGYHGNNFSWHVYLQSASNARVSGNTLTNGWTGLKISGMQDAVVTGNSFHDIDATALTAGGNKNYAATNIIIEKNRIYDVGDALIVKTQDGENNLGTENFIIRNNLFYSNKADSGLYSWYVYTYIDNTSDGEITGSIYNNTFYNISGKTDLRLDGPGSIDIVNNIFLKLNGDTNPPVDNRYDIGSLDYNLYHTPSAEVRYYGPNAVFGNPYLVDPDNGDFHLQDPLNSWRAFNQGKSATGIVDDDFDGVPRPDAGQYDIGAYELSY